MSVPQGGPRVTAVGHGSVTVGPASRTDASSVSPAERTHRVRPDQERATRSRPFRGRRAARVVAQAAVLAVVAAATSAFAVLHKTVTVDVDGTSVRGRGLRPDRRGHAGERRHRRSASATSSRPSLDQPISRSRPDRRAARSRAVASRWTAPQRSVWTTALTVGEAVDGLGLRDDEVRLSASRSAALGRDTLRVSTLKTIHLVVDGQVIDGREQRRHRARRACGTSGWSSRRATRSRCPLDSTAVDGLVVLVTRASTVGETVTEAMPFESTEVEDPGMIKGNTVIATKGKAGVRTTTYELAGRRRRRRRSHGGRVGGHRRAGHAGHQGGHGRSCPTRPSSPSSRAPPRRSARSWRRRAGGATTSSPACCRCGTRRAAGASTRTTSPRARTASRRRSRAPRWRPSAADWQTNPATQITWGLNYIGGRYGDPCGAYAHSQAKGWY